MLSESNIEDILDYTQFVRKMIKVKMFDSDPASQKSVYIKGFHGALI